MPNFDLKEAIWYLQKYPLDMLSWRMVNSRRNDIEPIPANIYNHKTLSGNFVVKNPHLEKLLIAKGLNTDEIWQSIIEQEGSVCHLDQLSTNEKDTFKTAFEIDQRWIIELAADRAPFICQGQSINLFLPADINKWDLLMLHWMAWEKGVKSLY